MPYILREKTEWGKKTGRLQLVGEAYVHEFMHGEFMEQFMEQFNPEEVAMRASVFDIE